MKILFWLWLCLSVASASQREILGGHEGWLDRMGAGIKELGMGNTGTAAEDAMPAAYWNPAILPFNRQVNMGVGADVRSLDRNGGYLGIQGRVAGNMGMGLGMINRGDFNVQAYDADEKSLGTARPQAIGSYLGVGVKTSRSNAFGAAVQWYSSSLDVGDAIGDVNLIGIFNLGWYKRWGERLRTAVVLRNLGMNGDLSARFDQSTFRGGDVSSGFASTDVDYFPKTLVGAVNYTLHAWNKDWDLAAEVLDFQLKDKFFVANPAFHSVDMRAGVNFHWTERIGLRTGYDRGNYSLGFGFVLPWGRHNLLFDYALLFEQGLLTVNPYAIGLRFTL
jgi:hypothetical protein